MEYCSPNYGTLRGRLERLFYTHFRPRKFLCQRFLGLNVYGSEHMGVQRTIRLFRVKSLDADAATSSVLAEGAVTNIDRGHTMGR